MYYTIKYVLWRILYYLSTHYCKKKRKQKTKQTRKNQHNFPLFSLACKFHNIPAPFKRAQFFEVVFNNLKNV